MTFTRCLLHVPDSLLCITKFVINNNLYLLDWIHDHLTPLYVNNVILGL